MYGVKILFCFTDYLFPALLDIADLAPMLVYPNQNEVAAATPVDETSLAVLLPTLLGAERARYVGLVAFVVLVYDHLLTLDEEVRAPLLILYRN